MTLNIWYPMQKNLQRCNIEMCQYFAKSNKLRSVFLDSIGYT